MYIDRPFVSWRKQKEVYAKMRGQLYVSAGFDEKHMSLLQRRTVRVAAGAFSWLQKAPRAPGAKSLARLARNGRKARKGGDLAYRGCMHRCIDMKAVRAHNR